MQDYWNDPPDEPEHPECCGELVTIDGNVLRCEVCGHCQELDPDPEEGPEPYEELPDLDQPGPALCPHALPWGECEHCEFAADLAYDAMREKR